MNETKQTEPTGLVMSMSTTRKLPLRVRHPELYCCIILGLWTAWGALAGAALTWGLRGYLHSNTAAFGFAATGIIALSSLLGALVASAGLIVERLYAPNPAGHLELKTFAT